MYQLSLQPINRTVTILPGSLLLPALLSQKLNIAMSCGGNGICSTCHVRVRQGADQLAPMQAKERRTLALVADADATSRLACQTYVQGDGVSLELPRGMYIEKAEDLLGLLGLRAPDNILHPIRGHVLIPQGKIITRTLLEQSRTLEDEVKRMKEGLLGRRNGQIVAAPAERAPFTATGRGVAPRPPESTPPPVASIPPIPSASPGIVTTRSLLTTQVPPTGSQLEMSLANQPPRADGSPNRPPPRLNPPSPTSGIIAAETSRSNTRSEQKSPSQRTGSQTTERVSLRTSDVVAVSLAARKNLTATTIHPSAAAGPSPVQAPTTGSRIGKFLLVECIGKGGLGLVYRALHTTLNIPVAVKFLKSQASGDTADFLDQFRAEARLLAQLSHPNVVRILDFEDEPALPYVVMELIEGLSIQDLLAQTGRIWWDRAVGLLLQAVDGLEAAWRLGIVHRDVKPANILVTRDGTAKMVDFGLAVRVDPGAAQSATQDSAHEWLDGTIAYMCPERARNPGSVDFRADIYSLGITFFQMVTGRLPFSGGSVFKVMTAHLRDPVPAAHELVLDVPPTITEVIHRMTAKQLSDRYQTYDEVRAALRAIQGSQVATATGR